MNNKNTNGNRFRKKDCVKRKNYSNLRPHLLTEVGWRYACLLFEDMREIGFFIKTKIKTNFSHGLICSNEHIFCLKQLTRFNDLRNTLMQDSLTDKIKVT